MVPGPNGSASALGGQFDATGYAHAAGGSAACVFSGFVCYCFQTRMFVLFSNRLGCLGSLVVSIVGTILVVALIRACSGSMY